MASNTSEMIGTPAQNMVLEVHGLHEVISFTASSSKVLVGSGANCQLRIPAASVAPTHCFLIQGPRGTAFRAVSPLTLNGQPATDGLLQTGDRLSFGDCELVVVSLAAAQPAEATPLPPAPVTPQPRQVAPQPVAPASPANLPPVSNIPQPQPVRPAVPQVAAPPTFVPQPAATHGFTPPQPEAHHIVRKEPAQRTPEQVPATPPTFVSPQQIPTQPDAHYVVPQQPAQRTPQPEPATPPTPVAPHQESNQPIQPEVPPQADAPELTPQTFAADSAPAAFVSQPAQEPITPTFDPPAYGSVPQHPSQPATAQPVVPEAHLGTGAVAPPQQDSRYDDMDVRRERIREMLAKSSPIASLKLAESSLATMEELPAPVQTEASVERPDDVDNLENRIRFLEQKLVLCQS